MAGISKKTRTYKNGKTKTFYTITYRDIFGKQHTAGCYNTKAEAKEHINDFNDVNPDISEITFEQIFRPYMELVLPTYSHTTQATYNLYIKNHFEELFPLKYDKISSITLQKFIDNIAQEHSPFVAQLCLKIAKSVCNYALKHKLINENKFLVLDKVVVQPKKKHHLSEEQEREVLRVCKELYPKYFVMFQTLMGTGMRIGELLALEIDDINFETKSIKVNKQFTKGVYKEGTKNRGKEVITLEREVYLTDDIINALYEHIKTLPFGSKLLFPNKHNGYLNVDNIRRRVWQPLLVAVGINERVRMHDLRGSYADIADTKGASLKFIQNQLGHTKSQTTLDVYMKNNQDMIESSLGGLNGVFSI